MDRAVFDRVRADLPLVGYSAGNFGKNLLLSTIDITFVFLLTDLLHIAPGVVGGFMLVVFFGDLLFDFGAGYLTAWASRRGFGYRRIIAIGALPCGAAFALLYALPALGIRSFFVLAAALLTFKATYAVVDVPHNSLLARVASDSRARGRASGYRSFFSTLASLSIATVLAPAVVGAAHAPSSVPLALLGLFAGSLFCGALWLAAWSSGPRAHAPRDRMDTSIVFFPTLDRPMLAMFAIAVVTGFAMPMFTRMVIYVTTYVLHAPSLASRVLFAITLGQFPGVILWTYLIRFSEKTHLLASSYCVTIVGLVLFILAGANPWALVGATIVVGAGLAGVFMLPWGILADIIDVAEFAHRQRRETAAFASMLVILKAGAVAGSGTIAAVLELLGYRVGIDQNLTVRFGMECLAIGFPLIGSVAALLVLSRLKIGHQRHARVLRVLHARRR